MLMEQASGSRKLRAPQGDGQTVVEPPLRSLPRIVADNRDRLAGIGYDVQGQSLAELSASARRSLLQKSIEYTARYRNVPHRLRRALVSDDALGRMSFILAGHQPQLFHPGVWYKNFVLGSLARELDAIPIHLLIDSDQCRSASIRVPTGSIEKPLVDIAPYDAPATEMPYEERSIGDFGTLQSFAGHVSSLVQPFVGDPLVRELWPLVLERNPGETNLGLRLAQGRHALEETWQNDTLELPQSVVCQLPEFAWFLAHVLAHLPRFWSAYNDALATYRRTHHMRNRAHPVPDLAEADGWLEAPFWIWTAKDPQRRPLFARQSADELAITDRQSHTFRLSLTADRDAGAAADQLVQLASQGIKIRTRALTTTLFARVVLSDLFLHGIGGAKYDQVTDEIARNFFGFDPPEFAAVSATLRLPVAARREEASRDRSCAEQLRELKYHPERYVITDIAPGADAVKIGDIIAAKRRWVETEKTLENARERHNAIAAANSELQPFVANRRRAIKERCEEIQTRRRADAILQSREYSFCLFPREHFEKLL
jgi:hypothetical protein